MRALQIAGNSSYGGGDYLLIRWCRYLLDQGWDVDVLATDPVVVAELQRIPRLRVITSILIPRDIAPGPQIRAAAQLFALLRRERYAVVHTYTATPGFLGRIIARMAGVPVILHHQAGWAVNEFSSLSERLFFTPLEYIATLASTRTICVSHADAINARRFHCAPQSKLVTICNGIDPSPFAGTKPAMSGGSLRRELGIPETHLVIGNTGRLAAQKDNASLIRAMASLRSLLGPRPFTLLLAGDGPERDALEQLRDALDLRDQVRFLGFRRDIPAILEALDIFVSPSLWEGLSISILEAMAAARPIVTTSILANAELIEHEVTGLLAPPRAPEVLATMIARFANEPELALQCATQARSRVMERYSLDRMLAETLDLQVRLLPPNLRRQVSGSFAKGNL
ncbi:MAG: glycosyltransferase family 4 protein [Oscillochloridaceae bacterium]|nr:glycosyltransferase family 4 protein [Chloroflexaceae bacterium]MDW8391892.1 glycosyltransferase family 4 protein [Oscillochloridaceae bacterium]